MKKIILLTIIILCSTTSLQAAQFQYNLNFGTDNPDSGEARTSGATLIQFNVINGKGIFKLGGSFTYLTGSQQFSQGDFNLGPYIYPLQGVSKSPLQPFIFSVGKIGFGTLSDKMRMDTGFGLGAGVDIQFSKKWGITIALENHSASESAIRTWLGVLIR